MTTREFDGLRVIADEPASTPLKTKASGQLHFKQVRELLLEDGSKAYGCLHCDYASRNMNSIRPHLKVHNRPRRALTVKPVAAAGPTLAQQHRVRAAPAAAPATVVEADTDVSDVDDAAREFPGVAEFLRAMAGQRDWQTERAELVAYHEQRHDTVVAERDEWKRRAKNAERMLARLNDALSNSDIAGVA